MRLCLGPSPLVSAWKRLTSRRLEERYRGEGDGSSRQGARPSTPTQSNVKCNPAERERKSEAMVPKFETLRPQLVCAAMHPHTHTTHVCCTVCAANASLRTGPELNRNSLPPSPVHCCSPCLRPSRSDLAFQSGTPRQQDAHDRRTVCHLPTGQRQAFSEGTRGEGSESRCRDRLSVLKHTADLTHANQRKVDSPRQAHGESLSPKVSKRGCARGTWNLSTTSLPTLR